MRRVRTLRAIQGLQKCRRREEKSARLLFMEFDVWLYRRKRELLIRLWHRFTYRQSVRDLRHTSLCSRHRLRHCPLSPYGHLGGVP